MKQRWIWVVSGIVVISILALAGLAPLPGPKEKPSALGEKAPPGQSPEPTSLSGPPHAGPDGASSPAS
jgi:hypothetical protein